MGFNKSAHIIIFAVATPKMTAVIIYRRKALAMQQPLSVITVQCTSARANRMFKKCFATKIPILTRCKVIYDTLVIISKLYPKHCMHICRMHHYQSQYKKHKNFFHFCYYFGLIQMTCIYSISVHGMVNTYVPERSLYSVFAGTNNAHMSAFEP